MLIDVWHREVCRGGAVSVKGGNLTVPHCGIVNKYCVIFSVTGLLEGKLLRDSVEGNRSNHITYLPLIDCSGL